MPELHVSSLVVRHRPERTAAVAAAVAAVPGMEWIASENGKAVVVLTTDTTRDVLDRIAAVDRIPGVLATAMVHHHHEEAEPEPAEPEPARLIP